MTESYNRIEDDRNVTEAENEWDSALQIAPGTNVRKLIRALVSEADRIDLDAEDIYEAQHIDSATGEDLEKWGSLVRVQRQTGESDDAYRARIKAEFRQSTIETTFDEFAEFCASVLNTDLDNLTFVFNLDARPAQVNVSADPSVYSSVSLSNTQIQELLSGGVPAGHEVRALEGGTFRLKKDGDTDDADKGLTSDSISTGGTLASDIV